MNQVEEGRVARMREKRNGRDILDHIKKFRHRLENNTPMWECLDWIHVAQDTDL
jgi:hypothetical protein